MFQAINQALCPQTARRTTTDSKQFKNKLSVCKHGDFSFTSFTERTQLLISDDLNLLFRGDCVNQNYCKETTTERDQQEEENCLDQQTQGMV